MIKYFCDGGCEEEIPEASNRKTFTVTNGEHPHNGSAMYKDVCICRGCVEKLLKRKVQEVLGT